MSDRPNEGDLKVHGVSRITDSDQCLLFGFSRRPTDDEMRAAHEFLKSRPICSCPFCSKPTYCCPCSHCGEPDIPEDF